MIKKIAYVFMILIFLPKVSYSEISSRMLSIKRTSTYYTFSVLIDYWDEPIDGPNPCYGSKYCTFSFWYFKISDGSLFYNAGNSTPGGLDIIAVDLKTIKEVRSAFKYNFPLTVTTMPIREPVYDINDFCVTLVWSDTGPYPGKKTILPGQICHSVPPEDLSCNITGETTINHGMLNSNQLTGSKSSIILNVKCNKNAALTVFAIGNGTADVQLNNKGTLVSRLQVNDKSGKDGAKINVTENINTPFTLSSELVQTGDVNEGPFHGAGTVTLVFD